MKFDLDDLKKRLGIEGKYQNFKDFRVRVLDQAQKDCAKKSPLTFTWEPEKAGKKVIGLTFRLRKNKKVVLPPPPKLLEDPQLTLPHIGESVSVGEPVKRGKGRKSTVTTELTQSQHDAFGAMVANGVGEPSLSRLLAAYDPECIIENCHIAIKRYEAGKVKGELPGSQSDSRQL